MVDGPIQNITAAALPVIANEPPPEGRMLAVLPVVLTPTNYSQSKAIQIGFAGSMSQVRTLYVDNTANSLQIVLIHGVGLQTTVIPANGGAIIPTGSNRGSYSLNIATQNAPAVDTSVQVTLYNYEIPPSQWGGTQIVTISGSIPTGGIILWNGAAASVPSGYGLCDGSVYPRSDGSGNITSPDLRDAFIIGGGGTYAPGSSGGSKTIVKANLPNYALTVMDPGHTHSVTVDGDGAYLGTAGHPMTYSSSASGTGLTANSHIVAANAATGVSVSLGGSGTDYLPPYYALAYIMKL